MYGIYINTVLDPSTTLTGTNYGIFIDDISLATTGNYALYTNTGLVNFGDGVTIDGSQDVVQLTVEGAAGQSTSLAKIQSSAAGTVYWDMDAAGAITRGYLDLCLGPAVDGDHQPVDLGCAQA